MPGARVGVREDRRRPARVCGITVGASLVAAVLVAGMVPVRAAEKAGSSSASPAVAAGSSAGASDRDALERRIAELEAALAALRAEVQRLRAEAERSAAASGTGAWATGGKTAAIEELEKRVEALTLEIERLRIGEAAAPQAKESVLGFGPAASKVYKAKRGVSIGGYGEMLYENFDQRRDDGTLSGKTDQADFLRAVLYFGYKFNDRLLFNSEIEYEHAVAGAGEPGEVALEFAYIDFRATRAFGVRGGLLLIPMGFLNELHEPPIFHGARRPEVERVVIPTTWRENGIGLYGDAGPVSYRVYLVTSLNAIGFSAGDAVRGGRQEGAKAAANDLAVTARVDYRPVPGLLVGAAAFSGETGQEAAGLQGARFTLWDAHGEWNWRGLHLRALYARGILSDAGAVSAATSQVVGSRVRGAYGEVAYNVLAPFKKTEHDLSPFVRFEDLNTQEEVPPGPAADPENGRKVRTYGLTYRPIHNIAVKVDYQDFRNGKANAVDQINFTLGYLF